MIDPYSFALGVIVGLIIAIGILLFNCIVEKWIKGVMRWDKNG